MWFLFEVDRANIRREPGVVPFLVCPISGTLLYNSGWRIYALYAKVRTSTARSVATSRLSL